MIEITTKRFYVIGIVCFSIIGIANIFSFLIAFPYSHIPAKVASIGGIIFNFALVGLFKYLLDLEPKEEVVATSDDIDEIIKEVSNGKKGRRK